MIISYFRFTIYWKAHKDDIKSTFSEGIEIVRAKKRLISVYCAFVYL